MDCRTLIERYANDRDEIAVTHLSECMYHGNPSVRSVSRFVRIVLVLKTNQLSLVDFIVDIG